KFHFIGATIKEPLVNCFSIVEYVPTVLISFLFYYPLYYLYEKYNTLWIIKRGKLTVKS
ncbi:hypothetical protein COO02_04425, partial [Bacillus pseudomycoides]